MHWPCGHGSSAGQSDREVAITPGPRRQEHTLEVHQDDAVKKRPHLHQAPQSRRANVPSSPSEAPLGTERLRGMAGPRAGHPGGAVAQGGTPLGSWQGQALRQLSPLQGSPSGEGRARPGTLLQLQGSRGKGWAGASCCEGSGAANGERCLLRHKDTRRRDKQQLQQASSQQAHTCSFKTCRCTIHHG